ncbi:cupin 2 barrel domain-containing protein [Halosimplex carlsbadense 2-9-1]|uniref:Cupin 2 barrel domain-containing protein n=1 Tax=Halosimplex carlsbadense 2-9-1 TaxID=797114 RepID=M0CSU8_9EURY|nr:cupin domain-containing protein [Halosimplex carlsbadense]ELZ25472.1 cupin 2 barrel domain-containing protein [Halosimplex carlsbadense 2-9-1]
MSDGDATDGGSDSPVVSESDLDWDEYDHGERRFRRKRLGAAGGEELGTSLYELEPGKRTWPRHYHAGNEEAIYVLGGELTLYLERVADGEDGEVSEHVLEPGDYAALPNGPDHAHEVEAGGDETARFLVISTMNEPDLSVLVERDVAMLFAGGAPGNYDDRYLSKTVDLDAEAEYWAE